MGRLRLVSLLLFPYVGRSCVTLVPDKSRSWEGGFQITVSVTSHLPFERVTIKFVEPSEEGITLNQVWTGALAAYDGVEVEDGRIPTTPIRTATFEVTELKQVTETTSSYDQGGDDASYDDSKAPPAKEGGDLDGELAVLENLHTFVGGFGLIGVASSSIDVTAVSLT
jgi:hypothetical protein